MTGLIFVFAAVFMNAAKGFCSKKVSGRMTCLAETVDLNLIRNLICGLLGAGILLFSRTDRMPDARGYAIILISGCSATVNYLVWILSLKTDAYMLVSAANSASFLIPALGGILLFGETLTLTKGAAVLLIAAALFFLLRYQKGSKGVLTPRAAVLLFSIFFTAGISSFTQKWFVRAEPEISTHIYTFGTFLVSFLLLAVFRPMLHHPGPGGAELSKAKEVFPYAVFMGIALYCATFFQTQAALHFDAVVLYPLNNALSLTAGCFMSWIFFGEKPNRDSIVGMVFVFAALVLAKL